MTFIDANTPRADLEAVIVNEASLYARFDEARLLNSEYTDDELRAEIQNWIEEGDECAAA
jgi:hypothetical protein